MRKNSRSLFKGATVALGAAAFATVSVVSALNTSASAMSLSEAIQLAVTTNPEIEEADASRRATARELDAANTFYRPRLDFAAGVGPEYSNNPTTRARGAHVNGTDGPGVWMTRAESSLVLTETLFNGYAREREIDRQAARVDSARNRTRERGEAVALDVVRSYLNVLRNLEIVALAEENLTVHQGIRQDVQGRVDAGQSGVGDLQQAASRLASAKATLAEVRLGLDRTRINFEKVVGQGPDSLTSPDLDETLVPGSEDGALKTAVESSPVMKLAAADVTTAEAEIGIAKSRYYPEIDLELAGSENSNLDGVRGANRDFSAMLKMRYNLYRGGADQARHRESLERHSRTRATLARLQRVVEEETRKSWSAMMHQDEQVAARSDHVLANAQVVETYRQEFLIGQRDLLDLLDSENELFNAQTQLITSESAAKFARYRLIASTGQLLAGLKMQVQEKPLVE